MKIYISLTALVLLSGCISLAPYVATETPYLGNTIVFESDDNAYESSVVCAMENITTPDSGTFFSYNSESLGRYVTSFSGDVILNSTRSYISYKPKATLKAKISGNEVNLTLDGLKVIMNGTSSFSPAVLNNEDTASLKSQMDGLLDNLKTCIIESKISSWILSNPLAISDMGYQELFLFWLNFDVKATFCR